METTEYYNVGYGVTEIEVGDQNTVTGKSHETTVTGKDKTIPKERYPDPPEGGWGWVVTFSAFMVGVILDGISFSFGLFFRDLLEYFNTSKSETSWIISTFNGTYLGIGPIAGILVNVFGYREVGIFGAFLACVSLFSCTWSPTVSLMILIYGFLGGAGLGLLYLPAIVTVGLYFKKKRALATGISVCGSGIGAFVFAPLCEFLIDTYSWKGAMWILSGVALNGIPMAALLRPLEQYSKSKRDIQSSTSGKTTYCECSATFDYDLLKSPTFLVYGSSCFLGTLGFYIPFTFLPDLTNELGMTSQQGAILISIIGAINTVARVVVGWLADRPWSDTLVINCVCLIIAGMATAFVPLYESFAIMVAYCVVFGIAIAVFVALRTVILAELLGIQKLTSSFGLATMCQGLSAFIGAPIAGALSDMTGDYRASFYMAGIAFALSGLICVPLRRISKWENNCRSSAECD